jgi:hypothetical protein
MKYFESKTASGNIQINDSFMNLYLSRKIPVGVGTGSGSFQEGEFLAAIGNGTNSLNGCCSNKPTGYDYKLNASNTQAYIYVFSNTPKSLGNCGLQVFNAAGQIIFDSNAKQALVLSCGGVGTSSTGSNLAIACGGFTAMSNYNSTGYSYIFPQRYSDTFYYTKQETKLVTETYTEYEWQTGYDGKQWLVPVTKTRTVWKTFYTQVPQYITWTDYTVTTWATSYYYRELDNLLLENGIAKIFKYSVTSSSKSVDPYSMTFSGKPMILNGGQVITNDQSAFAQDSAMRYQQENTWSEYSTNDIYAYSCVILDASFL